MPSTPHDALFKSVLSDSRHLVPYLRAILPPELLQLLDLSAPRHLPGSFVDPELAQRHCDLLFELGLGGDAPAMLYLLFEHWNSPCPEVVLRLLGYTRRIWDRWRAEHPGERLMPPVLPLVLYHGRQRWTAPRSLGSMLQGSRACRAALARYTPDFWYVLHEVDEARDSELHMTALGRVMLLLFRHAREPGFLGRLPAWGGLLARVLGADGLRAIRLVVEYVLEVVEGAPREEVVAAFAHALPGPSREVIMTLAEQWRQEGRAEGYEKGREEGREEGRLVGRREVLLGQLHYRFVDLPDEVRQRIGSAEVQDLDRWASRVLTAATVEEVFGE